uniref:Ig-like domain-containing protein n=1 Tax=Esox lucius TaxID=8010 RepID=A0A6Q2WPY6_ESOLU
MTWGIKLILLLAVLIRTILTDPDNWISEPLSVFFSVGEEVVLRCDSDLIESDRVVWYRRTPEGDNVFLDTKYPQVNLAQDLDGRINATATRSFLALSNLSLMDTGEYWCGVFYEGVCVSVTKTLLLVWDPFGINSTFYRVYSSLMACALLGMVCVLITVNLKTRRRDQASLKTRWTAAQTQRRSRVEEEREEVDEEEKEANDEERVKKQKGTLR